MGEQGLGASGPDLGSLAHNFPFSFRVGSVGAGIGAGCGVGVGFGSPLSLGGVPAIGQAISGITSGLGAAASSLGGAGHGLRDAVRRLGVRGLDAGLGCGVGVGYGFGVGLFLKPSAGEQLLRAVEGAAGGIAHAVNAKLAEAGLRGPLPGTTSGAPAFGTLGGGASGAAGGALLPAHGPHGLAPGPAGLLAPAQQPFSHFHSMTQRNLPQPQPAQPHQTQHQSEATASPVAAPAGPQAASPPEPSAEEWRALLRHERQIARLRAENRALRRAVCKLDRRLPICKDASDDWGEGDE
ncbi:hypothetical protein HYH03_008060 [Edaphochlamys debaryana]|uniref:Uncharacterized protein n=1 Tax=Edaphochlamys debaryana TaxID=47281 RepID=A0A835Y247_9CHLO|nr:hypothetical protein HYH03_008060 [Edaphochlamys debaryana]|eukprot:KAG2493844.1 hypothetical protein HYH03_008060 [Edaphochlamys debaryana]